MADGANLTSDDPAAEFSIGYGASTPHRGAASIAARIPRTPGLRFRVDPRDWPADKTARLLGLTVAEFSAALPRLRDRGFPAPDPTTGHFDCKAVEAWMDSRSTLTGAPETRDAAATMRERIARM